MRRSQTVIRAVWRAAPFWAPHGRAHQWRTDQATMRLHSHRPSPYVASGKAPSRRSLLRLPNNAMTPSFQAVTKSTKEAVYNAVLQGGMSITGYQKHRLGVISAPAVKEILRRHSLTKLSLWLSGVAFLEEFSHVTLRASAMPIPHDAPTISVIISTSPSGQPAVIRTTRRRIASRAMTGPSRASPLAPSRRSLTSVLVSLSTRAGRLTF